MKAVVLVGGFGTRLRPLTYTSTKALLPVVNVPFLDRLVARLEGAGVKEILLAVNHRAEELDAHVPVLKERFGVNVTIGVEPEPRGSGGALKFNEDFLDETFLLLNGDVLTDVDYAAVLRFHREKGALVTVNTAQVEDPSRFGVIDADADSRVLCWQEKPSREEARSNWVNVGIWAMEPSLLSHIADDRFVSLEKEVFPALLSGGAPFYAYQSKAYWADIGTPESYAQIHRDVLSGAIKEPIVDATERGERVWVADDAEIASNASLAGPVVIGPKARLGDGVVVGKSSVIGAGCEIGPRTAVSGSILWEETSVGEGSRITNSILGRNVRIADRVCVADSVVADNSVIDVPHLHGARIGPGTTLAAGLLAAD